ncbi:LysE family translocator [Xylophilus sp.]|uniref:LysE family translocator n=1 Tax=Xylophilus sp. TaxID=2653893 RepID=UPI0013BB0E01|nr:LysE family transporter [Xylophilus sp.]KAF1047089.1 MAG: Threonine efflux protein [Xylophilus sp.]
MSSQPPLHLFLVAAGAHFLALLLPGPDFLLILRTALAGGRRRGAWLCLGIACANAFYIGLAIAGFAALRPGSAAFTALQAAAGGFLLWLGLRLLRDAGAAATATAGPVPAAPPEGRARAWATGFIAAMLNPKNGLAYAGLFAALARQPAAWQLACGAWMAAVVFAWDLLVCRAVSHRRVAGGWVRHGPLVARCAGTALALAGLAAGYTAMVGYLSPP